MKRSKQIPISEATDKRVCIDEDPGLAGSISKIHLKNFMNHTQLDLELTSGITWISGVNGSGKSAILQSIILGLGGIAKTTKRGTNVSDFVKKDADKAEICIHLQNRGEDAFRQGIYGGHIVFVRFLFAREVGSSKGSRSVFQLKSEQGTTIYQNKEAFEEKNRILDHFGIELDNPTIILQQEEAKVFFKSQSEKAMYDFFLRSTSLKKMQMTYKAADLKLNTAKLLLEEKKKAMQIMSDEKDNLVKKFKEHDEARKALLQPDIKMKWYWYCVKQQKEEINKISENLAQAKSELNEKQEESDQCRAEYKQIQDDFELEEAKLRHQQEDIQEKIKKAEVVKKKFQNLEDEYNLCQKDLDSANFEFMKFTEKLRTTENELRAAKLVEKTNELHREREKQKLETEQNCLERKIKVTHNLIDELGAKRDSLKVDESSIKSKLRIAEQDERDCQQKRGAKIKELNRIEGLTESRNDLCRFGDEIKRLVDAINKSTRFGKKPIGPIGHHIRKVAENKTMTDLLETELGQGFLKSFIVNDMNDLKVLEELISTIFVHKKHPTIYVSEFTNKRFEVSSGQVKSSPEMPTVLDLLVFDNPDVFNCTVEYKYIESTVVIEESLAQEIFSVAHKVPKNARKAITPNFYSYYPQTTRSHYSSYYMDQAKSNNFLLCSNLDYIEKLKEEILVLSNKEKKIAEKINNFRIHLKKVINEKNKVMKYIIDLNEDIGKFRESLQSVHNSKYMDSTNMKLTILVKSKEQLEGAKNSAKGRISKLQNHRKELKEKKDETAKVLQGMEDSTEEKILLEKNYELSIKEGMKEKMRKQLENLSLDCKKLETSVNNLKEGLAEAEKKHQKARERAMYESKNQEMEVSETLEELNAIKKLREARKKKAAEELGMPVLEAASKINKKIKECRIIHELVASCERNQDYSNNMNEARKDIFKSIRNVISRMIAAKFSIIMDQNGLEGKLDVDHKLGTLSLLVSSSTDDRESYLPLTSLSGGERSKCLTSFITSLWEHQMSPFRCLDEWDVYLDGKARHVAEKMFYSHTKKKNLQYIFVSPQQPSLENDDINHVIIKK